MLHGERHHTLPVTKCIFGCPGMLADLAIVWFQCTPLNVNAGSPAMLCESSKLMTISVCTWYDSIGMTVRRFT